MGQWDLGKRYYTDHKPSIADHTSCNLFLQPPKFSLCLEDIFWTMRDPVTPCLRNSPSPHSPITRVQRNIWPRPSRQCSDLLVTQPKHCDITKRGVVMEYAAFLWCSAQAQWSDNWVGMLCHDKGMRSLSMWPPPIMQCLGPIVNQLVGMLCHDQGGNVMEHVTSSYDAVLGSNGQSTG